jgi:hypothetical protein
MLPNIERQPRTVHDTATHYGYCAFQEIELAGPSGLEHNVQPSELADGSPNPYYRKLPVKTLIPFTNVEYRVIDELATKVGPKGSVVAWKTYNKFAKECVQEMTDAYADWGFALIAPLTGYSLKEAWEIFETLQPFNYKLKDLIGQLDFDAIDRIGQQEPYNVSYEGEVIELQPLRNELKSVAEEVRQILARSAEVAFDFAAEKVESTRLSVTSRFAGGPGKTRPDSLDRHVFAELGETIPTLLASEKEKAVTTVSTESSESLDLRRQEIELRQKEIELRERELALKEQEATKEANREKMERVRAAKTPTN